MIAIIVAMDEELNAIKNQINNLSEQKIHNLPIYMGNINDKEFIISKSGVGKVNAARITQMLIDKFDIEFVINLGSAGAVNEELEVGDVVIGKTLIQHDFDITAFNHEKGYITKIGKKIGSDKDLINRIKSIFDEIKEGYNVIVGTIATGDIFLTDVNMKNKIRSKFNADCVEMEGGAIAQVCYLSNIPFVIVRGISDKVNGNNNMQFNEYLEKASERSSLFITKL